MAGNPERGEVAVTVGDGVYTLRPTFDSLCELEEIVGKPLHELMQGIMQGRLSGLRAVVWCFLQDQHAADFPTLKHASVWIEAAGGIEVVRPMVERVLGINAPEAGAATAAGAAARPRKARAGTGGRSSRTRVRSV